MGSTFSAIDIQTRMEVQDLLSRFCHALDYGRVEEWQALFAPDATLHAPRFGKFQGRCEVAAIPRLVAEKGNGHWRHFFDNVVLDRIHGGRAINVTAYCTVHNWQQNDAAVRCWDFKARIEKKRNWQILDLNMQSVGEGCEASRAYAGAPVAQMPERLAS